MGIDSMRVGGGRCPPFLVGGLLVACLILICNWWTLSSENLDLVRQIDDFNEQLKISAEERDQCVTLRGNLEQRYKHAEDEVASLHVRLEQQNELKKKNNELEESVAICRSELDSLTKLDTTKTATLETLRLEKETINTQLDVKKDENKKLQEEVDQIKDELAKVKLSCNPVFVKKSAPPLQPTKAIFNKTQLGPLPESAVRVSVAGQRGLKYHGIPILPTDPTGAVRQIPRFSVTMLKARTTPKPNDTGNEDVSTENSETDRFIKPAQGSREEPDNEGEQETITTTNLDKPNDKNK